MMTAFMSYLLLDNDTSGRFQALIAAAVFRKEPVRWISSPALITLDGRRLSRLYRNRSTPSIGLRAIVVPLSMHWLSRSPVRGGSHSRLSWNGPDCRHGGYGARDAAIEKKDVLKARGYAWSPGEFGRPKCWYRDVRDSEKLAEASWLRANVIGADQALWALRITARDRYSDRCWHRGEPLSIS